MKSYSVQLSSALQKSLTKLATCMLITRTDNASFGFTTYDKLLSIGGVDYLPAASFNPTDIASTNNLDTDNLTVDGLLDATTITEDDLRAGRWDYAYFRIFQVNYVDLGMGDKKDRAGRLGDVTVNRQTFIAELLGLMESYGTIIGKLTQAACRYNLGDADCGYTFVAGDIVTGTIDTAPDFFTLNDLGRTEANRFFNEGSIEFGTGPAGETLLTGLIYEIKSYVVGTWTTKHPMAYDATGYDYTMTRGCDRLFDTCRVTFSNVQNFGGEPWLRGPDALVQIGRHT